MKKIIVCMMIMIFYISLFTSAANDVICFYVSPSGNDYNSGTKHKPYKTLYRAREAARYLKKNGQFPANGIRIVLEEGEYFLESSFYLDSRDSGISFESSGNAVITGGLSFDNANSEPVTNQNIYNRLPQMVRDMVRYIDLSPYFNSMDIPVEVNEMTELKSDYIVSWNNEQMTNARYPNNEFMTVDTVYQSGTNERHSQFIIGYEDDKISQWENVSDIYLEGYGRVLWRYQKNNLESIDSVQKKITSKHTFLYTGIYNGAKVWFSNVLEELDVPGEWYIDRADKKLYYYPITESGIIKIAKSDKALVEILNTENIQFKGIIFENTRTDGIKINGCTNIVLDECIVRQTGSRGLEIKNSAQSGIKNSYITGTGCGGVFISGGRKYDITPSSNFVLNNDICDFSKIVPTYSPAVWLEGIGDIVSYNSIHESFHSGIIFAGNDNIISHNEIYNVLLGTEDAGAIYAHADGSARGNIIENNFIHHVGLGDRKFQNTGIFGIYFDNFNGGQIVRNNLLYDMPCGVHINGGGHNQIDNNIFSYVDVPIFSHIYETSPPTFYWNAYYRIDKNVNMWEMKYPELKDIPDMNDPYLSYVGNKITNNIFSVYGNFTGKINTTRTQISQNMQTTNDVFENVQDFNFQLTEASEYFIPFDYTDVGMQTENK